MKKFVKVTDNYSKSEDDFTDESLVQEELIPVKNLIKIYKYKGGKPILAYLWQDPASGLCREWFQIFHNDEKRETLFDKLTRQLC